MRSSDNHERNRLRIRASIISLVAGTAICGLKFGGYAATGSYAILSDALESIINVAAAGVLVYSLWGSSRKADTVHPYGRGRMEYFSAGFEGALILLAGIAILYESLPRILHGNVVNRMDLGLIFTGAGTLANLLLGYFLLQSGKKHHSIALEADGKHVLSDVVSSVGLFIGLVLVHLTNLPWMDPLLAALMGIVILYAGFRLVRQSYHNLMDRLSPAIVKQVVDGLKITRSADMIKPHKLRLRESGSYLLVDFHLIVPRYYKVGQVHQLEERIHKNLSEQLDRPVDLLLHSDPCTPGECSHCAVKKCPVRAHKMISVLEWEPDLLLRDVHHRQRRHSI